jgi:hypothetical protein
MSGAQTTKPLPVKPLKYQMNLSNGTTCRDHMPFVVADAVP